MDYGERDPSSIPVRAGMPMATMEAVKSCLGTFGTVTAVPEKPYEARVAIAPSKENIQAVGKARLYQDERGYYLEFRRRSGDGALGGAGVNGPPRRPACTQPPRGPPGQSVPEPELERPTVGRRY